MSVYVSTRDRMSVQIIAEISILRALAFPTMMFEISLPLASDFYKLGLDEVTVLIGGFALDPWAAICIEALKIALNLFIRGTTTIGIGELTNFLIGLSFILSTTIIYQRDRTKKHALLGLIAGTICVTILGGLLSCFVILSAYPYFMNLPLDRIIEFSHAINPNINGLLALVLMATTPFNVLKGVLYSIVVFLSYEKVSPVIKKQ